MDRQRAETTAEGSWLLQLPRDLWALIRELQGVEEAVKFALACRESLAIVKSSEFWNGWKEPVLDLSRESKKAMFYFFVQHCIEVGRPLRQVALKAPYSPEHYTGKGLKNVTVRTLVMTGNDKQVVKEEKDFLDEFACIHELVTNYTSDICQHLQNLTNTQELRSLTMYAQKVTDDSLQVLRRLRGLERLSLRKCDDVTDTGLRVLASMPQLRELSVRQCTQILCAGLRDLPQLTKLTLQQPTNPGADIIEQVSCLRNLQVLDLFQCTNVSANKIELLCGFKFDCLRLCFDRELSDKSLQVVSQIQGLQALHLKMTTRITVNGLEHLQRCHQLEHVVFEGCDQLRELSVLESFRALGKLWLTGTARQQSPPAGFEACHGLQELQLKNYSLSDETMSALQRLQSLTELQLTECSVTGSILGLKGCRSLRTIVMFDCFGVSAASRKALSVARPDMRLCLNTHDLYSVLLLARP